ncbi:MULTISPECIES: biotin--[acetyl-CoA-carboxylase] ligase [Anoxybacillaceae]|uniref:Bifunctional ligase/repressor BirA n=1 Tax=Anoxybacteroides rupiense TaxID=311460 RepID=A0ABD5IWB4_9BACL|nr:MULTISPECIES: biotin--[acetyl-CoA-carboxylase] ligase [Anoxybacillus]MED5051964.1 biotin--[acetyl-CoA-carboxylase] ligase [Anoxybacillus rupiensis]OQM45184.1 bifunctional biotin--[acetyl-CoA-carboxylase] synthetase/biotin operon repressor [Anoxybacillus sp. UARK-01]
MAHFMQSDTRKKLLELFSEANGDFISGQKISDILGCSRTAVWKHIEDLRKEGFELEAVRRLGYRIVSTPDKITANEIRLGLKTEVFGQTIYFEEEVTSTQKMAHQLAHEGAKEGTIVVAELQTAGRGRMDRKWFSPKGTGVWMSLILRPPIPPQKTPQLTLLTAVAIVQAIQEVAGLVPDIKWPNDILINGKKCVGILTELQADPDRVHSVTIGMGVNVNHERDQFPEDLRGIATSLAIEKGEKIKRARLIQEVLLKMETLYRQYLQHGFLPIKLLWEGYAISIGKEITARTLNGTIRGFARGITDEGVLILEDHDGTIHHIHSADISL